MSEGELSECTGKVWRQEVVVVGVKRQIPPKETKGIEARSNVNGKRNLFLIVFPVIVALGIAAIFFSARAAENSRVRAFVAAHDQFAQVLEEEAAKDAEKRDRLRMEEGRLRLQQEVAKTKVMLCTPEQWESINVRHDDELTRVRLRLEKAIRAADPEHAQKIQVLIDQESKNR